jgi:hypothetical protein
VQHNHRQPCTIAGSGVLQHLPIAGRVAERRVGSAADRQVDAFRFAGIVVVEEKLWVFG